MSTGSGNENYGVSTNLFQNDNDMEANYGPDGSNVPQNLVFSGV
jgi:hypothetical protein